MKIIIVKWRDASVQTGDVMEGQLKKECLMITAGIFVEQEDGYLSIAQEVYTEEPCFRYVTHIPNDMIVSKKIINVKEWK